MKEQQREKLSEFIADLAARVVEAMESGEKWSQGWVNLGLGRHLKLSDAGFAPYQGSNQFFLSLIALSRGLEPQAEDGTYTGHLWGGAKTWMERGLVPRKGTKSMYRPIRAYPFSVCNEHPKCSKECLSRETRLGTKLLSAIFHVSQVTKMTDEAEWPIAATMPEPTFSPNRVLDHWKIAGMVFREVDSDRAYFSPSEDYINLPPIGAFKSEEAYYATLFHEATHWTGHKSRLDRPNGVMFGDAVYAKEELIAEIGSAMIGAELGLMPEPHPEIGTYLASWISALKAQPEILYEAATAADRATKFLVAFGQLGEMAA